MSSSLIKAHLIARDTSSDALNAFTLQAGFTPISYTPAPVASEAATQLSAHLNGIGNQFTTVNTEIAAAASLTVQDVYNNSNGVNYTIMANTSHPLTVTGNNGDTVFFVSQNARISGTLTLGTLNGVIRASSGILSASNVSLTTDVTGVLPIANGGTNSSAALTGNSIIVSSGGALVEAAAIGANVAIVSNSNGLPVTSVTTATEISYVSGVTSSIQTQINTKVNSSLLGVANGVATLDSGGKVFIAQLPNTVMLYLGAWNASTNTPALADGTGTNGDTYRASVAGTQNLGSGSQTWSVGDLIIYNGSIWQHAPAADGVSSVNGFTGAVVLTTSNIAEGSNLYFTTSRAQAAISATAPLSYSSGVVSIPQASSSVNGYLASSDWSAFNNKQAALTFGSVSTTTPGISIVNGASSTVGPNVTVNIQTASATLNGLLSATDWSTFNAKENIANKGIANGYADLDSNALVPLSELPASIQTPFYTEWHVSPGYTGPQTGTYNQPYATIQDAINAAQTYGAANAVIFLHGQSSTENITINNYSFNLLIESFGSTVVDNQTFVLNGNVTISGLSTRIRLKDIKIQYPGGTQPDLIDTSAGRNYFSNVGFEGGGGIQFSGSWARWREFTDCTISGPVSLGGTPVAGALVSTWRVRGGGNYTINASGATLALYDNFSVGNVTQTAGSLIIDGGRGFVSGSTISSTSNSPDTLSIINVSLEASDNTFIHINKTGNCSFVLSNVLRDETGDTLTGTRLNQGSSSSDVRYVPTTSTNWSSPPASVIAALDDVALASNTASATKSGILSSTDWSTFNGKQPAGTYITALSGDIAATGPGSVTATIQANVVSNAKLAQMAANTIKGNNTGSLANTTDLTTAQVAAILPTFVGDTGTGGVNGLVPAPAAGTRAAGDFLGASGGWAYVDQSKPIYSPFSLVGLTPWTGATTAKFENLAIYTGIDGHKQYAAVVAGGSQTLFIWDITNPAIPTLCSYIALAGAYNIAVAQISGSIYAFVPSSGGSTLYTINITNPYSLSTTSSLAITGSPGSLYCCVYSNGYVYIATQSKGLTVVDVGGGLAGGTITTPIQSYQEGGTTNKSGGVAIFGNIVYTTNYQTTFPATVRYLKTWELAAGGGTLAVPFLANTYTIPGGPTATSTKPLGIAIDYLGTTAFVTDGNQGVIDIIDVTSPTSPNYLTYVTPSYTLAGNSLGETTVSVTSAGDYIYIPSGANVTNGGCIDLFDCTIRSAPVKIKSVYTGVPNDVFGGLALNNGYIFAADYGVSGGYSSLAVFTQAQLNPTFALPITSNIQVAQLTPNTALTVNASQQLASSTTTATELSYVHGVTSPIQAQINAIGSSVTLQGAYNNSSTGIVALDNTRSGFAVSDASTPLVSIFAVNNNANSTSYLNISASASTFMNNVGVGVTPAANLHVRGGSLLLDTSAGNYYNIVQTNGSSTDASDTTIANIALPTGTDAIYFVETRVTARRTGGLSGSNGDSGIFTRTVRFAMVAGVITEMLEYTPLTDETYSAWTVRHSYSGSNILVIVNGSSGMNINWYANNIIERAI